MVDPNQLAAQAFLRATEGFSLVSSLRKVAARLPENVIESLKRDGEIELEELRKDPEASALVSGWNPFSLFEGGDKFVEGRVAHATFSFKLSVDAASLKLAHSFADEALTLMCKASVAAEPASWLHHVKDKTFKIRELGRNGSKAVEERALNQFAASLSHESLPKKCDFLLKVCKPKREDLHPPGYSYSRERIERLDKLRHNLIHESAPRHAPRILYHLEKWKTVDEDVDFLGWTPLIILTLVQRRHGLSTDPTLVFPT